MGFPEIEQTGRSGLTMGKVTVIIVLVAGLAMASVTAYWYNLQARLNADTPNDAPTAPAEDNQ